MPTPDTTSTAPPPAAADQPKPTARPSTAAQDQPKPTARPSAAAQDQPKPTVPAATDQPKPTVPPSTAAQDPPKPTASATADKSAASAPPAASTKPAGPGRPKDLSKRNAILEAAKRLFLSDGYDGVSMDQIAAGAGVSKLTVYSHFGDKETLFSAAVQAYCEQHLPPPLFEPAPATALRERLIEIATAFYEMISTPEAIQIHRLLCSPQLAESPLSKMFWDAGPQRLHDEFAALLQRRVEAGELEINDPARAATQFFALIKGEPHAMLMFGCGVTAPTELTVHIEASVAMFLRAYARREP